MSQNNLEQAGSRSGLSTVQLSVLTVLRMAIGWHFLYEGVVKLLTPGWSCAAYLAESRWIFSGFFNWVLANPSVLRIVDLMNVWGLILIGLGLIFGALTRAAIVSGILLLLLYYVANPPLIAMGQGPHTEGNYLFVDKNLVEIFALSVLFFFPTGRFCGVDRLLGRSAAPSAAQPSRTAPAAPADPPAGKVLKNSGPLNRREILKSLVSLPVFGGFVFALLRKRGWESYEEKHLLAMAGDGPEALTSATIRTFQFSSLKDLKGSMTYGQIGDLKLSRLILGGNLIGGWAHSRDLVYVSKLVKAYHHDQKVFETFRLAEKCGVNTFLTNPVLCRVINKYWRTEGGKIQFISDCSFNGDVMQGINVSVDGGAKACYVQGGVTDRLVKEGNLDAIAKALELIRSNGLPAGIGAHSLESVTRCVDQGLIPDFWVKTLHHIDYWSARPGEQENDNIWCTNPEETVRFMNGRPEPWIAFKILAAGAIPPEVGFPYAFKSGADFICVGMYDFQIVDDVNLANSILAGTIERERRWMA
jgi:uncharacterized membrane protein YphA (DoxX/SURF4 family)